MSDAVASGYVSVKRLSDGAEWDEKVVVFPSQVCDTDGTHVPIEDAARRQARRQAGMGQFKVVGVDVS
jgi:hypothetical protein